MDNSTYCPDLIDNSKHCFPFRRESSCIAFNKHKLDKLGVPVPDSYEDLLKPCYRGLVTMPNPKLSGAGYNFLKNLSNECGEQADLSYFDEFSTNIYQFTSSCSGPTKALVQSEALIGFCMTYQVVEEINNSTPLQIIYFKESSPWDVYSNGIMKGKSLLPEVKEVFQWIATEGLRIDNSLYVADEVLEGVVPQIENYPKDVNYANMDGINDIQEKNHLLAKWKY